MSLNARRLGAHDHPEELDGRLKTAGKTTFVLDPPRSILDGLPFLPASVPSSRS